MGVKIRNLNPANPDKIRIINKNMTILFNYFIRRKLFVFFPAIIFLYSNCSIAQKLPGQDSSFVTEGGKTYRIHVVEKKETVYAISKKYNISIDSLKLINPFINEGLKAGQELKIPVAAAQPSALKNIPEPPQKTSGHTVEKGETLYSISQKYSVSLNTLLEMNPQVKGGVISPGQVLQLPFFSPKDSLPAPKVQLPAADTTFVPFTGKVKIGLILPFHLSQARDTVTDLDMETLTAEQLLGPKTIAALNYYEGMKMALDSFAGGLDAEIRVFDCGADSAGLQRMLAQKELIQQDVVLAPFHFSELGSLLKKLAPLNIPLITSSPALSLQVKDFPNLYSLTSAPAAQCSVMAHYLTSAFGKAKYTLVYAGTASREKELGSVFKNHINTQFQADKIPVKEITYGTQGISAVKNELSKTEKNVIIVPSSNSSFVVSFLAKLVNDTAGHDIVVAGLPTWAGYETIDLDYLHALKVHLFSDFSVAYEDSLVLKFRTAFRERYATEPQDPAFEGFDQAAFLVEAIVKYGKNFRAGLNALRHTGMHTEYNLDPAGAGGGLENKYVSILKYEDYQLKKIK
jgi:LysM repeat protein